MNYFLGHFIFLLSCGCFNTFMWKWLILFICTSVFFLGELDLQLGKSFASPPLSLSHGVYHSRWPQYKPSEDTHRCPRGNCLAAICPLVFFTHIHTDVHVHTPAPTWLLIYIVHPKSRCLIHTQSSESLCLCGNSEFPAAALLKLVQPLDDKCVRSMLVLMSAAAQRTKSTCSRPSCLYYRSRGHYL